MMAEGEICKMCDKPVFKNYYLCEKCANEQYINDAIEDHERRLKALEAKI